MMRMNRRIEVISFDLLPYINMCKNSDWVRFHLIGCCSSPLFDTLVTLAVSLMAVCILMRRYPSLADELVAMRPWTDARQHATTLKCRIKHSTERQGPCPFCVFFYYKLLHTLIVKLHLCMCLGGNIFRLIHLWVERLWIVVDNKISCQSYDY